MNHRLFFEYFHRLLGAGIPILRSLDVIMEERPDATWVAALRGIRDEIETGSSLSDAVARRPDCFPPPLPRMIAVVEEWGRLDYLTAQLTGDNGRRFWAEVGGGGNGNSHQLPAVARMLWRVATCMSIGMPIVELLQLLAEVETDDRVREVLITTADRLAQGDMLTESFGAYPDLFSPATLALVERSETGGDLSESLRMAAEAIEAGIFRPRPAAP